MQKLSIPFEQNLFFICTRKKENPEKNCCGKTFSSLDFKDLKCWVKENKSKHKVKLVETGCQGYCPREKGIVTHVERSGKDVFSFSGKEELKQYLQKVINNG